MMSFGVNIIGEWCQKEWQCAKGNDIPVIVVVFLCALGPGR